MKDIEKNDVDISKLFEFKSDVELHTVDGKTIKVYLRLPNDGDIGKARVRAIRDSAKFRNDLRNPKWEDREVYLPDVSDFSKEDMVSLIKSYSIRQISVEVSNNIEIPFPKEPDGEAVLEVHEEYQKAIDEYPALVNKKLMSEIKSGLENLEKVLKKKTKKQLIILHERELIKELSDGKFGVSFRERNAYYSTFSNKERTQKFFSSYEELRDSPTLLKEQLMNEYSKLELGSEALKKSLGVTQ